MNRVVRWLPVATRRTILGLLALPLTAAAGVSISGGNRDVTTTYVTVTGSLTSVGTIGMWYEVRQGTTDGVLLDYGARKAESSWSITVRHLRMGTNWLVVRTKNSAGVFESASVALNFVETSPPTVRPRPRPSEIWWGGLSDNSQLLDPARPWDFVKQYQDGYFVHSAQNWGDLTSSERTQLANALKPFNTKFMIEVGGRSDATTDWPDLHTSRTRAGYWKTVATAEGNGIYFSEVTHDFHADDMVEFCRVNPSWPAGDQLAVYTGDYGTVTTNVPVPPPAIGWGRVFSLLADRYPYAKVAHSYSPIYFKWKSYPALSTDNMVFNPLMDASWQNPILVNGQTVSFNFNEYDVMRMMATSCTNNGQAPYAFATDCPWQATGNWSVQSRRLSNREKIRTYEGYLQGRSARHYRICNDNGVGGSGDAYDNEYKRDSLKVMYLHQNEGGRAQKYIFESWYGEKDSVPYIGRPYTAAPESKPGSFSNLALDGIKYLKGIRTNGSLQSLDLIVTPVGSNYLIQLRNDGDIACLPAVQAITSGNPLISLAFTNYAGANATTALKSEEGYPFVRPIASNGENDVASKLLQPGETATVGTLSFVVPPGAGGALNVALEAYWNPQDPTGVIRDRVTLSSSPVNTPPTLSAITAPAIFANTNTGPLAFTIGDDLTPAASLTLEKLSSNPALVPEANIVFGGSGADRTVTVTPASNQSGSAMISIIASDGSLTSTTSFTLTVLPPGEFVTVTNHTPGTLAWKCPPGVTHVEVECFGGGGAGGSARNVGFPSVSAGGGGGAGGAYARRALVPVTPGNSYPLTIPEAAVAPDPAIAADGARVNGAAVSFVGDDGVTVTAAGGQGGATVILAAASHRSGLGGVGSSAGCVGDAGAIFAGGNGSQATTLGRSGAGGGGAGDANLGGNASETTLGVGGVSGGGNGGSGKTGNGPGNPVGGGAAGGGGGGRAQTPNSGSYFGASGALGQINLTYISIPNQPPVLAAIEDRTVIAGQTLAVSAQATDSDVPAQTLTYSLVSPPSGAAVDPSTGIITWRPTMAQSPSSHPITIKVADNGTPNLSASRTFQVTVQEPSPPVLTISRSLNGTANLMLNGDAGPDYAVEASGDLKDWQQLWSNGSAAPPYQFDDPEAANQDKRFYRVGMGP